MANCNKVTKGWSEQHQTSGRICTCFLIPCCQVMPQGNCSEPLPVQTATRPQSACSHGCAASVCTRVQSSSKRQQEQLLNAITYCMQTLPKGHSFWSISCNTASCCFHCLHASSAASDTPCRSSKLSSSQHTCSCALTEASSVGPSTLLQPWLLQNSGTAKPQHTLPNARSCCDSVIAASANQP